MRLTDILLYLDSYPDATPPEAIEQAVKFAKAVGGRLSALAIAVDLSTSRHWLADRLIGLGDLCAEEEAKSVAACKAALQACDEARARHGVSGEGEVGRTTLSLEGRLVAARARTRDLCLLPIANVLDEQNSRSTAEAVIFGSGRPILLFRPGLADLPDRFGTVVLAWDGSRAAARAMADALPLLGLARQVRVLTVLNEKPEATAGLGRDVTRHLKLHGIDAVVDEIDGSGRRIGQIMAEHCAAHRADLLVMGVYGRSRASEFIFGGATQFMLDDPRLPLLLSR
jgi:nucleotide-binding universal stress UspA family protein